MMLKICRERVRLTPETAFALCRALFRRREGELVRRFENNFARYIGRKHAVAVSCGKIGLALCLEVLGAEKGDAIIVPGWTVPEVIEVIRHYGLEPVFVDVVPDTATMDPDRVSQSIGPRTKFLLMTHMFGFTCDAQRFVNLGKKYGLTVIEDAAQACGAEFRGRKAGSFGKVSYFSFGLLKNLNTLEGGMILTDDPLLAQALRRRVNGFPAAGKISLMKKFFSAVTLSIATRPVVFSFMVYPVLAAFPGLREKILCRFKQPEVTGAALKRLRTRFGAAQAAIGIIALKRLDAANERRRERARLLDRFLETAPGIILPARRPRAKDIYLHYAVRVKNRDMVMRRLFARGIDAGSGMVVSCAHLEKFREFFRDCPESLRMEREHLYLPVYEGLNEKQLRRTALELMRAVEEL